MFHVEHKITRTVYSKDKAEGIQELFQINKAYLNEYIERLLWWNKKINLISRGVSRETILKHVEHSLVISSSQLFRESESIIDAGTGGGLPGVPLAITHPEKEIVLNDIVAKKVIACKQIASGLGLANVEALSDSIENIELNEKDIIISKHAFKINDLIEMIREKPWSGLILLKGANEIEDELSGIGVSLNIQIFELELGFQDSFYSGKAMIEITKRRPNE